MGSRATGTTNNYRRIKCGRCGHRTSVNNSMANLIVATAYCGVCKDGRYEFVHQYRPIENKEDVYLKDPLEEHVRPFLQWLSATYSLMIDEGVIEEYRDHRELMNDLGR